MQFQSSPEPTLGVEIELAVVDAQTMALANRAGDVLARVPEDIKNFVKPELMQCYLELNTGICRTVDDVEQDLQGKLDVVGGIADELGVKFYWTGTHPFSLWADQRPTPNERYGQLLDLLQDVGRQLVTFGLHVHVGVDSGEKAIMICERIMRHLPLLLAASCNSPWWEGRVTGLMSHRSQIMEALPTAGLPPMMRNWSEFVWLVRHLEETKFINSIRDIWWTVRPHHNFGTVEVRVCDMPGDLEDVCAIAALVHALVRRLSDQVEHGAYQHDCHPMLVSQNMWRAERFGLDADFVDTPSYEKRPSREMFLELVDDLETEFGDSAVARRFERLRAMANEPSWARRQLNALDESGDPAEVVRRMIGF